MNSFDFSNAKLKHGLWKMKVRSMMDDTTGTKKLDGVSHRDCALGQWLYSKGLAEYGAIGEMNTLERTHREMHEHVNTAIDAKKGKDMTKAEQSYSKVVAFSDDVIKLLDQVEAKVKASS